jgi:hypothetical protein
MMRLVMRAATPAVLAGVVAVALAAPLPAAAQLSVALYAGYGGSNGVDNVATGSGADLDEAATFGIALSVPLDAGRELQVMFRQQSTTLAPGAGAAPFDVTIRQLHVGGTVWIGPAAERGFYAVGGAGVTQFSPSAAGYGSDVKPSLDLGIGYRLPLGPNVALLAEARGYLAFVNSSGGFLCSGGCIAVLKSDAFTQIEGRVGVAARF